MVEMMAATQAWSRPQREGAAAHWARIAMIPLVGAGIGHVAGKKKTRALTGAVVAVAAFVGLGYLWNL